MRIADAFRNVSRVFLDSAPVIYFVEKNPQYADRVDEIFNRIDNGTLHAVTSPVTLIECLVQPLPLGQVSIQQNYVDLIVHGQGVTFVGLEYAQAMQAADMRARYNLSLSDAAQIGTALESACDAVLTNDLLLKKVTEIPIIVLDELTL